MTLFSPPFLKVKEFIESVLHSQVTAYWSKYVPDAVARARFAPGYIVRTVIDEQR